MPFQITYRANGKLLLTGEYLVLHGAKAIAIPLNLGQQMYVTVDPFSNLIHWQALHQDQIWFSCELNRFDFSVTNTSNPEKSDLLARIFKTIKTLNPEFQVEPGTSFKTILESSPEWGFGSSSTLISNLAQWSGVDPFKLNELVFNGSGFDIACATADGPIFYSRNNPVIPVSLNYQFSDQLFLVYSGQKKKTATEVSSFLNKKQVPDHQIAEMTRLSDEFATCCRQSDFNRLIRIHEKLIGQIIGQVPVKEKFFADFDGEIKSLGAWGGDFMLVSTRLTFQKTKKYFENKGLTTLFKWDELILKR